jgi:hypothetical protein
VYRGQDLLKIIKEVEESGFSVKALFVHGPIQDDPSTHFTIVFDPVSPDERRPVEAILEQYGMKVTGGGTALADGGMVHSDVSFEVLEES